MGAATAGGVKKQLHRHLGVWSVVAISMGAMMGSGIFVLPLLAAEIAGPWVLLSYLLAGLLVVPAVMSKAELATAMPVSGGTYVYLDRSMGPWVGTIGGLGTWLALSAKTAFALVGLGAYLVLFSDLPPLPFALAVLAGLVFVNIIGAGKASLIQLIVVVFSAVALTAFAIWGFTTGQASHFVPAFPQGAGGLIAGAGFVFVSYNGVTKVCSIAEEIKNPSRNIPLGMGISLVLVMTLYVVISYVVVANVDMHEHAHDTTPIATAAASMGGQTLMMIMAGVAVVGLISMCNAGVLATSRFPFAMARDGLMPPFLQEVTARFGTPARSILLTGALLTVLVVALPVYSLAKLASGFTIFIFCIVNLSVIVLRETGPAWYRPTFQSPLYPWTQIVGILGGFAILAGLGMLPLMGVGVAVVLGSAWYLAYGKRRTDRTSSLTHLFDRKAIAWDTESTEERAIDLGSRVIVPIFGDEAATKRLLHLAGAFGESGLVEVMRLEEVAHGVPLDRVAPEDGEMDALAAQTQDLALDGHVDVEFRDLVTHNAKRALMEEAARTGADWIVMGWPSRKALHYLVRHPMAWWLNHPPCDLAIFLDRGGQEALDPDTAPGLADEVRRGFQRILVLAEPGPYDFLSVHVADNLAAQSEGRVTLVRVVPASSSEAELAGQRDYHEQLGNLCTTAVESLVLRSDDLVGTLQKTAEHYDLLIMGAPPERGVRTVLFRSASSTLADRVSCSVLSLKAPRHTVHRQLTPGVRSEFSPFVQGAIAAPQLSLGRKRDLFARIAQDMAETPVNPLQIERALTTREVRQNTALRIGVSLTAPVIHGLPGARLGVFTTTTPIDFQSPERIRVDVCIVVLAPPGERSVQLGLLAYVTRRLLDDPRVLDRLRGATSAEALREALL